MDKDEAMALIDKVQAEQAKDRYMSAVAACKAAGVAVADYKDARSLVLGPNQSA